MVVQRLAAAHHSDGLREEVREMTKVVREVREMRVRPMIRGELMHDMSEEVREIVRGE